jgi:3-oxoacyl-[acyl-carrier-protein] synthase-3
MTAQTASITQHTGAAHTRVMGVGAMRPERVVTNEEVCTWIDSSDEWIRERSGIVTRRFAAPEENVVDMALPACRDALEMAGLTAADVDAVIVSTVTWYLQTPSAAAVLAERLGATPAAAFDLSAACAGFCHGVGLASDMIRGGSARHVLVVGVEKLSDFTDKHDRGTAFLFGDGAGAVVVGPSDTPGIGPTVWGSDGSKAEAVGMNGTLTDFRDGKVAWPTLRQEGPTVFRWAVWEMVKVARQALEAAGIEAADLAAFVPHQANMRIIDEFAKQLGLPDTVVVGRDIETTGNTSAASIPLATHRLLEEHPELSGGLALQIGFGAGLVFGAQVVVLP